MPEFAPSPEKTQPVFNFEGLSNDVLSAGKNILVELDKKVMGYIDASQENR